jgi:hypothetical protein
MYSQSAWKRNGPRDVPRLTCSLGVSIKACAYEIADCLISSLCRTSQKRRELKLEHDRVRTEDHRLLVSL